MTDRKMYDGAVHADDCNRTAYAATQGLFRIRWGKVRIRWGKDGAYAFSYGNLSWPADYWSDGTPRWSDDTRDRVDNDRQDILGDERDGILEWLRKGRTGESSVYLAALALGDDGLLAYVSSIAIDSHPLDPIDLARCLLLERAAPISIREALRTAASTSETWARFEAYWGALTACLDREIPDWPASMHGHAPETTAMMEAMQP